MEDAQQVSTFYLNSFDIAVLAVIGLSSLFALFRGFIREMLSLLGWIASAWIAFTFLPQTTEAMKDHIAKPEVAKAAAAAVLFFGSLIGFWILNSVIFSYIKQIKIGAVDRTLGFAFGFLRGLFLISLAFLLYTTVMPPNREPGWLKEAQTKRLVEIGAGAIRLVAPEYFDELGSHSSGVKDTEKTLNSITEELNKKPARPAEPAPALPQDSEFLKILKDTPE